LEPLPLNPIPERQNAEPQMKLLRARSEIYRQATTLLVAQFMVTVILPVAAAVAALLQSAVRPYTAGLALAVSVIDVTVLDRRQRARLKLAARLGEMFDCAVLAIPWNAFVAGRPVEPETITEAATAWRRGDGALRDWYPVAVGQAPLFLARVLCQRTNLWYDAKLRRDYSARVITGAVLLLLALFVAAYFTGLTVELFIASVVAPAGPVLIWSLRESYRQRDTAEAQEALRGEADGLWDRAKTGQCLEPECAQQSRDFQNAIFARRVSSPLMLPGVYGRKRPALEAQMNRGAEDLLAEIAL
jgi:SMODS-associating 4TM effector domain